jgi:hypothetical protein
VLETTGLIVAPVTLIASLLYYFGIIYTGARLAYFGIEPSVLGLSTQEYLMRGLQPIFVPLGSILATGIFLLWMHSIAFSWLTRGLRVKLLVSFGVALGITGLVLLTIGMAGLLRHPIFGVELLVTPLSFALGVLAVSYAVYVGRRIRTVRSHRASPTLSRWVSSTTVLMIGLLLVLNVFWVMGDWAKVLGAGRGEALVQDLPNRPGVILYSKQSLGIDPATGVREERVAISDAEYHFRYRNLKLLLRSGGKYFLLPSQWSLGRGIVIALQDDERIRIEFTPR